LGGLHPDLKIKYINGAMIIKNKSRESQKTILPKRKVTI
jgi:hypothetical protein